jgi:hypothetical protein
MMMARSAPSCLAARTPKPDGSITYHCHCFAWPSLGADSAEAARAEHVGGGEQARDEVGGGDLGCGDEGAVG